MVPPRGGREMRPPGSLAHGLLPPERLHRIQPGGSVGGDEAEDEPDGDAYGAGERHAPERSRGLESEADLEEGSGPQAGCYADRTSQESQRPGLHQELPQDLPPGG